MVHSWKKLALGSKNNEVDLIIFCEIKKCSKKLLQEFGHVGWLIHGLKLVVLYGNRVRLISKKENLFEV